MVQVEFNNQTHCSLDDDFVAEVAAATLKKAAPELSRKKKISASVAAVAGKEIARLNSLYRKKNKVTDVLSFSAHKNETAVQAVAEKELYLGEVILCCEYIRKSATMNKLSFEYEAAYVISHGILHLLGRRHGKPMFAIQDEIATRYDRRKK